MSQRTVEGRKTIPVMDEVDVVVAGAGVAAALGAARAGARTVLVERGGYLGGVAAAGLMTSLTNLLFTGDGRQVVKGACEEVLERLVKRGATSPHWRARALPQIPFEQQAFRTVLIEMVRDAGVETWVADVVKEGDAVRGVIVEGKGGPRAILCKVAVDATGDADLAALAGAPFRDTPPDSGSLLFLMSHVDLDKTAAYFEENPDEWQQGCDRMTPI